MPAPAIVDKTLFEASQEQLRENRTRARLGERRPGYLLQGLTCCALCGYAFYGKTTHQRGRSGILRDFSYYRCSGTDGYRFGGERICSNTQVRADTLENQIWENVCKILRNPGILEQEGDNSNAPRSREQENIDTLMAKRQKLGHGMDRLIDIFAEGVIEKDQFTARINRTKARIAEIDATIAAQTSDGGRQAHLRSVRNRLTAISSQVQNKLSHADWTTKREIIRALIQQIEIGQTNVAVALRLPTDASARSPDRIMVTLSRA
jgi:site-specific DNA recombinase